MDENLFGLGQERYEALVGLLIQLRQPQLSKKPDEKLLSRALTQALPPLDPALVGEIAEAFRGLDEERQALQALMEASGAASAFLGHYRRYARVAAKRQAAVLRLAHSKYEHLGRDLGEADSAHDEAHARLTAALRSLEFLNGERVRLSAAHDALNRSPEMDAARELEQAGKTAATLARAAADRDSAVRTARSQAEGWERRAAESAAKTAADARELDAAEAGAAHVAREAGIDHPTVARVLDRDLPPYPEARRAGEREAERRAQAVAGLESLLSTAEQVHERARAARAEASRAGAELADGRERVVAAETAVSECGTRLAAGYRAWFDAASGLHVAEPEETIAMLESWADTLDGPNPAAAAAAAAHRLASAALTRRETELDAEHAAASRERAALDAEVTRLEAGGHEAPPAAHTRDQAARAGRPGAPLWRAVDFAETVREPDRAGIESALEAAGLLDAWLTPDGALLVSDTGDAFLLPDSPAPSGGLTAVLRPAVDRDDPQAAALSDDAVHAVLAVIGLGECAHPTWVAADGGYRIGALRGSWSKGSARYIGEGSREAARRARLTALATLRAELDAELDRIERAREQVRERAVLLAEQLAALPSDEPLRTAHNRLSAENDVVRRLTERSGQAALEAADCQERAEQADAATAEYAQDTDLPAERSGL
ncbi:MAG: TIGR02680 family protein, partial [Actinocrinis sp.]